MPVCSTGWMGDGVKKKGSINKETTRVDEKEEQHWYHQPSNQALMIPCGVVHRIFSSRAMISRMISFVPAPIVMAPTSR